jgi:hypothetical protein
MIKGGPAKVSGVMLTAFFITAGLYTMFHFGINHIMGTGAIAANGAVGFTQHLGITSPYWAGMVSKAVIFALMLALFNAVYGVSMSIIANLHSLASKNHLAASRTLTKVNGADRPYFIIGLQAIVVFLLMTFVGSDEVRLAFSNFGIILALLVAVIAVLKAQIKQGFSIAHKAISLLAIAASAVLVYYSWNSIGATTTARIINATPFIGGLIVGLIMYYYKKCCNKGACKPC